MSLSHPFLCSTWNLETELLQSCSADIPKVPRCKEIIPAMIIGVYDGDTITAIFVLSSSDFFRIQLRINGIDSPELRSKNPLEKEAGKVVKNYVKNKLLSRILPIQILKWDKYGGRMDAEVYLDESCKTTLSQKLLRKGLVKPFSGTVKKEEWTDLELKKIISSKT